jgi:hypothetical protein
MSKFIGIANAEEKRPSWILTRRLSEGQCLHEGLHKSFRQTRSSLLVGFFCLYKYKGLLLNKSYLHEIK